MRAFGTPIRRQSPQRRLCAPPLRSCRPRGVWRYAFHAARVRTPNSETLTALLASVIGVGTATCYGDSYRDTTNPAVFFIRAGNGTEAFACDASNLDSGDDERHHTPRDGREPQRLRPTCKKAAKLGSTEVNKPHFPFITPENSSTGWPSFGERFKNSETLTVAG
jgi:hypothetical protein